MFVTNHVLSGALIGQAFRRRPGIAFAVGVGSHLVLDAVPHWGCELEGPAGDERFFRVARRDGLLGLAAMSVVAATVDADGRRAAVAGMVGAALLDLDKPVQRFFGVDPFPDAIGRLHRWVQNESPRNLPIEVGCGLAMALGQALTTRRGHRRTVSRRVAPAHANRAGLGELPAWRIPNRFEERFVEVASG